MEDKLQSIASDEEFNEDLSKVLAIPHDKLREAQKAFCADFSNPNFESLTAIGLKTFLVRHLSEEQANDLMALLMALSGIVNKGHSTPSELKELVAEVASKQEITQHQSYSDIIEEFLANRHLQIVYKSSNLYFESDEVADSFKILTEARPVFSKDGSQIAGYIIRNVLTIRDEAGRKDYALSQNDLEKISAQVARAALKTKTLKADLERAHVGKIALFGERYKNND